MTAEEFIVYCARVSSPQNQGNLETAPKLLRYLIKHGHWSPFEQASMTVEIVTSRAISAQILRHRSFVFQEFSQRYAEVVEIVAYDPRRGDDKNRQNSTDNLTPNVKAWFLMRQAEVATTAHRNYRDALDM